MFNNGDRDIYTLVLLMGGTLWGVFVKYMAYIKKMKEEFSFLIFLSEYFAHGFVGFVAFLICRGIGINDYLTLAISLLSAFIGLKMFVKFEDEILEGMDGISEKIKRWLS